jgi:hypothetical protein
MQSEWQAIMMADRICGESAYRSAPTQPRRGPGRRVRRATGRLRIAAGSALVWAGERLRGTPQEVTAG